MVITSNLGFPSVGIKGELNTATKSYLNGEIDKAELSGVGATLRKAHWQMQKDVGIDHIPSNDFTFYDRMLDMTCLLGAVPERFGRSGDAVDVETYFAMAHGAEGVSAMHQKQWFDTGHNYVVPELDEGQSFKLGSTKIFDEFKEAKDLGIDTRPVLIGPLTYLSLSSCKENTDFDLLSLLDNVLPVYQQVLQKLESLGAAWVQIDEPIVVFEQSEPIRAALSAAYKKLSEASGINILFATYFGDLGKNIKAVMSLPVRGVHLDLVSAPDQFSPALDNDHGKIFSLGVIDGGQVWRSDLSRKIRIVERGVDHIGLRRIIVAPSCALTYLPVDLDCAPDLDDELKSWAAFAKQKLFAVSVLAKAMNDGKETVYDIIKTTDTIIRERESSPRFKDAQIKDLDELFAPTGHRGEQAYA